MGAVAPLVGGLTCQAGASNVFYLSNTLLYIEPARATGPGEVVQFFAETNF